MKIPSATDLLIDTLVDATYEDEANIRQRFVFREALLGLVRMAKSEQLLEMRTTVEKLIGGKQSSGARQRTKSRQKNQLPAAQWPQQLQFSQFD
jgi:hypothetical protein